MKTNTLDLSLAGAAPRSSTPHKRGRTQETSWDAAQNNGALARILRFSSGVGTAGLIAFLVLFSEANGFAQHLVYVDWRYPDTDSDGSPQRPFYTFEQGYARVFTGGTLKIASGRYLMPIPLDKPHLLEPWSDGPVRLGGSIGDGFSPDRLQRPSYPTNLRSTQVENNGIRLDWDDTSGESGYRIYFEGRKPAYVSHNFSKTVGRDRETYTKDNLYPGFTYCVTIEAFNRVGTSAGPDEVCETIPSREDPPPPTGFRQVFIYNCHTQERPVYVWTLDITAGTPWSPQGMLPSQWSGSTCYGNAAPLIISLLDGHWYQLAAVDPDGIGCNGENDPTRGSCQKLITSPFKGDADGPTLVEVVGSEPSIIYTEAISGGRFSNLAYSPASGFQFTFSEAIVGKSYRIQSSPSGAAGSWTDFTNFIYIGPIVITDGSAIPTTNKFYRAVTP